MRAKIILIGMCILILITGCNKAFCEKCVSKEDSYDQQIWAYSEFQQDIFSKGFIKKCNERCECIKQKCCGYDSAPQICFNPDGCNRTEDVNYTPSCYESDECAEAIEKELI